MPRNPHGRTGIRGMGDLYRWGPNHTIDLIITRDNPYTGKLEMLLLKRPESKDQKPGIPGTFVRNDDLTPVRATGD